MSYSQFHVLQVFPCGFTGIVSGSGLNTVALLPVGEIGFFDSANALQATGAGRIVMRLSSTEILESNYLDNFAGWGATSYAAPTYHTETVTVATAVADTYYELRVEVDIKGMTGKMIKKGVHKSLSSGSTVTTIATALVASINAALTREGLDANFTVSNAAGVITILTNERTYDPGKKSGAAMRFKASLSYPEAQAVLGTVTVPGGPGVGHGPLIAEREFFAWGNNDQHRYNSWRNNFTPRSLADAALDYDVQTVNEVQSEVTANGNVRVNIQILVAFDSNGSTPAA